jgi:hypothetical protein
MPYSPTGRGRPCESWDRPRPRRASKIGRPRDRGAAYPLGGRAAEHGTTAARARHRDRGEPLCEACATFGRLPCGCPRTAATLEETLELPCGFGYVAGVGWVHE